MVYNTECEIWKYIILTDLLTDHLFLFFALRDAVAATVAAAVRFGALFCFVRGTLDAVVGNVASLLEMI